MGQGRIACAEDSILPKGHLQLLRERRLDIDLRENAEALALQRLGRFDEARGLSRSALDLDSSGSQIDTEVRSLLEAMAAGRVIHSPRTRTR